VSCEHELALEADAEEADQHRQALAVRMQDLEAEAVEAERRAAIEHLEVVVDVARAARVADDDGAGVDAFARQQVELRRAHRALIRVRGDRRTGRDVRAARGAQDVFLIRRDAADAGRHLDDAGADAGVADAVGELPHEELRHLAERVTPVLPELEVRRRALVLLVEARRADDVHAALLRDLGHELDVAAQVDRTGIDERAKTRARAAPACARRSG
jgi:hypothetical protein